MKRLTTHDPNRQIVVCSANYKSWNEIYDRLAAYEDLEEQGRLLVLPCKVGDTVYQKDHCGEIYDAVVQSVVIDKRRTIFITSGIGFDETSVGKTVFLTLAEAEAAMKGVSEDA